HHSKYAASENEGDQEIRHIEGWRLSVSGGQVAEPTGDPEVEPGNVVSDPNDQERKRRNVEYRQKRLRRPHEHLDGRNRPRHGRGQVGNAGAAILRRSKLNLETELASQETSQRHQVCLAREALGREDLPALSAVV